MERVRLIVEGKVTGVFFRSSTASEAHKLGLKGWVKNVVDSVEIVAEGPKENIEKLITWTKTGPPYSLVTKVKISWENPTGEFKDFSISG